MKFRDGLKQVWGVEEHAVTMKENMGKEKSFDVAQRISNTRNPLEVEEYDFRRHLFKVVPVWVLMY